MKLFILRKYYFVIIGIGLILGGCHNFNSVQEQTRSDSIPIGGINENYAPPKFDPKISLTFKKSYKDLKDELLYAKVTIPNERGGHKTIRRINNQEVLIKIVQEFDRLKSTVPKEKHPNRVEASSVYVITIWREGRAVSYVVLESKHQFYFEEPHLLKRRMPDRLLILLGFK